MDAELARRANAIVRRALAVEAGERAGLLDQLCASDAALRDLVKRLLANADDATTQGAFDPLRSTPLQEAVDDFYRSRLGFDGDQLGDYRLLRRLGIGGSAEVWLGEREVGGGRLQVAIKLLLPGAADPRITQRFAQEQRILAQLRHPGIGRLHDAGVTADGRPFTVMEYVDGAPIDQWCDQQHADLDGRLHLLAEVADAVGHAHRHLVVHRDIKPSNVLVDAHGRPRLIDFGIARLLESAVDARLTEPGGAPATLGYASPEQLRGEAVGIASDVYQLGMLAYVLLAGRLPSTPRGLARDEAASLAGQAAPSMSERLRRLLDSDADAARALAQRRRADLRGLLRGLDGDLDQIVARAIDPDPERRYPSAAHFADDLRCVLQRRPISLRRERWLYSAGKLLRRHPLASALTATLLAGILVLTGVLAKTAYDLDRARRSAVIEAQLAERVLEHVLGSVRALEPQVSGFEGSLLRHVLDRASAAPAAQFGEDPLVQVHLRTLLGRGYEHAQDWDKADAQYRAAAEHLAALPEAQRARAEAPVALGLGRAARTAGDASAAEAHFQRAVALSENVPEMAGIAAAARANLGILAAGRGERALAAERYRVAAEEFAAAYGPQHPNVFGVQFNHALLLLDQEAASKATDIDAALTLLDGLVPAASAALGADSTTAISATLLRGRARCYRGDSAGCRAELAAALPTAGAALGEHSLAVLKAESELGLAEVRLGERAAGTQRLELAAQHYEQRWNRGGQHAARHSFGINLALAALHEGDTAAADAALQRFAVDPAIRAATPGLATLGEAPTSAGH